MTIEMSSAMADLIALSKVKSHHKIVNGKVVFVDSYTNKVIKNVLDLMDPNGDTYDLGYVHKANFKAVPADVIQTNGTGLVKLPKGTKVYKTQTNNIVVIPPGQKSFTFKTNGEIVPTMKVMTDKADQGKLTAILPTITAAESLKTEVEKSTWTPVALDQYGKPIDSSKSETTLSPAPGYYTASKLKTSPYYGKLRMKINEDGSGAWLYSEIPTMGSSDYNIPSSQVAAILKDETGAYGFTWQPLEVSKPLSETDEVPVGTQQWPTPKSETMYDEANFPVGTQVVKGPDVWEKKASGWFTANLGDDHQPVDSYYINVHLNAATPPVVWVPGAFGYLQKENWPTTPKSEVAADLPVGTTLTLNINGVDKVLVKKSLEGGGYDNWHVPGTDEVVGNGTADYYIGQGWKVTKPVPGPTSEALTPQSAPIGATITTSNGKVYTKKFHDSWSSGAGFSHTDQVMADALDADAKTVLSPPELPDWEQELLSKPEPDIDSWPVGTTVTGKSGVYWVKKEGQNWQGYTPYNGGGTPVVPFTVKEAVKNGAAVSIPSEKPELPHGFWPTTGAKIYKDDSQAADGGHTFWHVSYDDGTWLSMSSDENEPPEVVKAESGLATQLSDDVQNGVAKLVYEQDDNGNQVLPQPSTSNVTSVKKNSPIPGKIAVKPLAKGKKPPVPAQPVPGTVADGASSPLYADVPGHGKIAVGPGQTLYLTKANNHLLRTKYTDGSKTYVLLKKDGKTGYAVKGAVAENAENGNFTTVMEHPITEAPLLEDSGPPILTNKIDANAYVVNGPFVVLKNKLRGTSYADNLGDSNWNGLTDREKAARLSDPQVVKAVTEAITTLQPVVKWGPTQIDKSDKMALGKIRGRFETLKRAGEFLTKLKANELTDAEITSEMAYFESRMGPDKVGIVFGGKWPHDVSSLYMGMSSEVAYYNFAKKITHLGWTPDTATPEQLSTYIKTEGKFTHADLLSDDEKKNFVKKLLSDPSVPYGVNIDSMKAKAAFSIVKANLALKAQEAVEAAKKDTATTPNVVAVEAAQKVTKNSLKTLYNSADKIDVDGNGFYTPQFTAAWQSNGSYYISDAHGEEVNTLSEDEFLDALAKGQYGFEPHPNAVLVNGPKSPYAGHDFAVALQNVIDQTGKGGFQFWSKPDLNAYIKTAGGNYVGAMDSATKHEWIFWHAKGDLIAEFTLEANNAKKLKGAGVHKDYKTHPGSADSPAGKKSYQALADWISTQPWGEKMVDSVATLNKDELIEALNALDMQPFSSVPFDHQSTYGLQTTLSKWLTAHPHLPSPSAGLAKQKVTEGLVMPPLSKNSVTKPSDIDEADWNAALGLENDTPGLLQDLSIDIDNLTNEQTDFKLGQSGYYGLGMNAEQVKSLPLNAKKFVALYLNNSNYDTKALYKPVIQALAYRLKQGAFLDNTKPVSNWVMPNGNFIWLKPGDDLLVKDASDTYPTYLKVSADGTAKSVDGWGTVMASTPTAAFIKDMYENGTHIATAGPATHDVSKEAAAENGFSGAEYDALSTYEGLDGDKLKLWDDEPQSPGDIDDYLSSGSSKKWTPFPFDLLGSMPLSVKKYAVFAQKSDDEQAYKLVSWKASNGGYSTATSIDPAASYAQYVKNGQTDSYYISSYWAPNSIAEYVKDFNLYVPPFVNASAVIYAHLQTLNLQPGELTSSAKVDNATTTDSSELVFHEVPGHHGLAGMHSKSKIADQYGRAWMVKSFQSDPNAKSRIDSEHAANLIGRMFGFHQPETRTEMWQGKYSYIQHLAPAKNDAGLVGIYPKDLNDEQLYQAVAEHLLDWIVSNHDSHEANLLLAPNDKDIIGIDKGQAFKFFPNDKLAYGYLPPGNPVNVWYDRFYAGIIDGSISKERADKIVSRVLLRAKQMEKKNDQGYRDLLEVAFKSRKTWPNEYPDKKSFIDALMERKHSLSSDFEALYKGLYAKSSYSYDIDLTKLQATKFGEGQNTAYLDTSQELIDAAVTSKIFGTSVMYPGLDLEDGHMLLYTEKAPDGSLIFNGEAKVMKDADKNIQKWLQSQTVANAPAPQSNYVPPDPAATLPKNDDWYAQILNGIKTINTHATDQEFNASKIADMENAKNEITTSLAQAETAMISTPAPTFASKESIAGYFFEDKDQFLAWKGMAESYLESIKKAESAKATSGKFKGFNKISYVPKPKAKMKDEYTGSTAAYTLQEFDDGTWKQVVHSTGDVYDIDEKQAKAFIKADHLGISDVSAVSVGTKVLKVIKRASSGTKGTFDHDTGELVHNASDQSDGYLGYVYDVEYGDTRISYRPWSGANVAKSQQGLLTFHIKNFTDNVSDVEEALAVMRTMGLTLEPGDDTSLELLYWRMASAIMSDRNDYKKLPNSKVVEKYAEIVKARKSGLTPEEELAQLKAVWSEVIGADKVANADWRPKFDRLDMWNSENGAGHPFWYRPDMSLEDVHKAYGNGFLIHNWYGSGSATIGDAVGSNGLLPTEARLRVLGQMIHGSSSTADQANGAGAFQFFHQTGSTGAGIYGDPNLARRLHNYSFNYDGWGKIADRKNSNGSPWNVLQHKGQGEIMVKNGIGTLDGMSFVVFGNAADRDKAVKALAAKGITEIKGMPVTERFLTNQPSETAKKKAWDLTIQWEKDHAST